VQPIFRPASDVRAEIEATFPRLSGAKWFSKSPFDDTYQCIAWAAGDTSRKWWPINNPPECHWPEGAPFDDTVGSFVHAFATLGYKPCSNSAFELWHQKVAIYATSTGLVRHMARQHFFGRGWLSKPGKLEDIVHPDLQSIEGDPSPNALEYGKVVQILERSWWTAARHDLFCGWWAALIFWVYRRIRKS